MPKKTIKKQTATIVKKEKRVEPQVKRALVIDDYVVIRLNHRILLKKLGFEVVEAGNGKQAMYLLDQNGPTHFSLIIVDLFMPILDGEEFLRQIRDLYREKLPPILICSSNSDIPLIKKIAQEGISGYIIKPVDYKAFKAKIYELFPDMKPLG